MSKSADPAKLTNDGSWKTSNKNGYNDSMGSIIRWSYRPYTRKGKDGIEIDFVCLTMIDPASSWFKAVELPVMETSTTIESKTGTKTHEITKENYFDKTSTMISHLVNKTWFSRYPCCPKVIYDNGSEFKLHFEALCDSYGIKRKLTSVKNPQANATLEWVHQVIMTMLHTAKIDMAKTVIPSDIDTFLTNASWDICSTYHTVLKASPGADFLDAKFCSTYPT